MKNNNSHQLEKPAKVSYIILWLTLVLIIVLFLWAKFAIIDEFTRGQGKVIPSSQIQVIQNLEGGIVQRIFVKEGQIVQKGQVLMQLDKTRYESDYNESQVKAAALQIKVIRLSAQINDKTFIVPEALKTQYASQYQSEYSLYQNWISGKKQLQQSYDLAQKELQMTAPLVNKGAASPVEVLQLQQTVSQAKKAQIAYVEDALKELNDAQASLQALQESMAANVDRLKRTTVISPVKGIVKQIKITTVGGVSQPGMDLMEIVPLDDTLLIEAKVVPQDIGFIHIGQNAVVKITAFDSAIYGDLDGKVEQISADSIKDEKDNTFYLIRVRTDKNYLGTTNKPLYIIPGMTATVDIVTSKRSVLDFLLKPILKIQDNAFKEK